MRQKEINQLKDSGIPNRFWGEEFGLEELGYPDLRESLDDRDPSTADRWGNTFTQGVTFLPENPKNPLVQEHTMKVFYGFWRQAVLSGYRCSSMNVVEILDQMLENPWESAELVANTYEMVFTPAMAFDSDCPFDGEVKIRVSDFLTRLINNGVGICCFSTSIDVIGKWYTPEFIYALGNRSVVVEVEV